jgi:hypothetical protein
VLFRVLKPEILGEIFAIKLPINGSEWTSFCEALSDLVKDEEAAKIIGNNGFSHPVGTIISIEFVINGELLEKKPNECQRIIDSFEAIKNSLFKQGANADSVELMNEELKSISELKQSMQDE